MKSRLLLQLPVFCLLLGAFSPHSQAQNLANDQVVREGNFLFEVKIIDEFIERFNDAPNSNLRRQYRKYNKPVNFTRRQLLSALFEPPAIVKNDYIQAFINQVMDSTNPQYISFHDSTWYAELEAHFDYNGRKLTIPLVMQVVTGHKNSSKWMIAGIGATDILNGNAPADPPPVAASGKAGVIPPTNDALNFLELENALKAGMNPSGYFKPELLATSRAQIFTNLIQTGKLSFEGSGTLRYYFFQIPGYVFVVDRFVRNTNHSGWLISRLSSATNDEKQAQRQTLLQRPL